MANMEKNTDETESLEDVKKDLTKESFHDSENHSTNKGSIDDDTSSKEAPKSVNGDLANGYYVEEAAEKVKNAPAESILRKYFTVFLAVLLVITGSVNTIAAKWADNIEIEPGVYFAHPFFQATVMFVGEMCCMVAFIITLFIQRYRWKRRHENDVNVHCANHHGGGEAVEKASTVSTVSEIPTVPRFNFFLFAIPAFCDVVATSVQYLGLNLTSASSYQMLRGAVIIFTGLLSMIFLKMRMQLYRWAGMVAVVVGLAIVGIADIVFIKEDESHSTSEVIAGDVLIIVAQIVVAIQMVVEQKLLSGVDIPALFAVGLEGIFGFIILTILMIPMYYIHVPDTFSKNPENRLEDALNAFWMMSQSGELVGALCCTVVSIAFFNFAGISVTKYMSATTRMVLDSIRTIIIWAVSIPLFDSQFIPLQILGFVFLIFGMFIYNDILFMPFVRKTRLYRRVFPSPESK